ncbi:protein abrupt [Lasius niger]|uniref:Protein abrupt n=1 Tax=Lasius niger TaxID=67767 RepID=A0A0J7KDR7_LASNI|nr:protein abrupt [Lasius niger]
MGLPGPSGMHQVANQDPNYGIVRGWLRTDIGWWFQGGGSPLEETVQARVRVGCRHQHHQHHHHPATSQQSSQQHAHNALNSLNSLNTEQLTVMHQKLQNNLQSLQQSTAAKGDQLNLILQSGAKDKIESIAMLHQQNQRRYHQQQQLDNVNPNGKPKCPECGKIYSNNSNLKQHIVNVHTVQTEYISCHVCSKQFKTKQYLQIHLLSMHGIRKRKSYPLYQMQTHMQTQQQPALQPASQVSASQQQEYSTSERWSEDKQ